MIVQVTPYAGQMLPHRDAKLAKLILIADTGLHEQLRCLNGALREHDLKRCFGLAKLAVVLELNAGCATAVQRGCVLSGHPLERSGWTACRRG